jgi:hypothetical protein
LVTEIAKKFGWEKDLAQALSLSLYATEMVLVEGKGKPRLPIFVKKIKKPDMPY